MTASIKENISKNIAKYRKEKGLSQSALAEIIGAKNLTTVSSWERGISSPDADTIIKLCSLFDITLYDLYEVNGTPDTMTASQKEMLTKYEGLDAHGKEMVDFVLEKEYTRCENAAYSHLMPAAAHEISNSSDEDKRFDDEIMQSDNF